VPTDDEAVEEEGAEARIGRNAQDPNHPVPHAHAAVELEVVPRLPVAQVRLQNNVSTWKTRKEEGGKTVSEKTKLADQALSQFSQPDKPLIRPYYRD